MLQVYLVRYDCLKIQQLIPNRLFCILFYTICIIDIILLIFSCSFFLIPYQQQEFEQQYILTQSQIYWKNTVQQQYFRELTFKCIFSYQSAALNDKSIRMTQIYHDPYYQYTNQTTLYQFTNMQSVYGHISYQSARNIQQTQHFCFQVNILNNLKFTPILGQPHCELERKNQLNKVQINGLSIQPWISLKNNNPILYDNQLVNTNITNDYHIYYLSEICIAVEIQNNSIFYKQGCFGEKGLVYSKLQPNQTYSYSNTILYIRNINDPYIKGVEFSGNYQKPKQLRDNSFPDFIKYCLILSCALSIYLGFLYLILILRRNVDNKTQFVFIN